MAFTLPQLPYSYNAFEPYIDAKTMEIHHTKHHAAYIDNLNRALENLPEWNTQDIKTLLQSIEKLPTDIQTTVRNNAGGHYNHTFFWETLSATKQEMPPFLEDCFKTHFGDSKSFRDKFTQSALTRFGSGWAWLVVDSNKALHIVSTPNQDSPISAGNTPILGLDVWEHAYYLNYQNRRADYISAWWNVINWRKVEENLKAIS